MNTNRPVIVLLSLTVAIQAATLLRDYVRRSSLVNRSQPVREAPKNAEVDIQGVPVAGNQSAEVVLIEFSDYECPFCARHAMGVGKQLDEKYVVSGKIRHAFMNNPLPNHGNARLLATAAICGGQQNHYWPVHDALFRKQPKTREEILTVSMSIPGMDTKQFLSCLNDGREAQDRIERDQKIAKEFGLSGTPAFAIGRLVNDTVAIEKLIVGSQELTVFEQLVDHALKTVK